MLKLIFRMKELDFSQFLEVCRESALGDQKAYDREFQPASDYHHGSFQLFDYMHSMFSNGGACAVWIHEGTYVSALRLEPYRDGYLIAGLETAQDQRGKGFATKLIMGVATDMATRNVRTLYSHVKKNNRRSLRVHEKCGFVSVLDYAVFLDGSVDTRSLSLQKNL